MLLHDERQEGAEYVAANGGVGGVEDWARPHEGLATPEEVLHLQEIAVAQNRLQRRDFGVGSQDQNAVELRLVSQLAGVDLEDLFALGLLVFTQIPPVAGVANQSLIATLQPILQGDDNGFAVLLVFFRLGFVAADDVTLAIGFDFLEAHHRGEGHGHLTIHCEGRVAQLAAGWISASSPRSGHGSRSLREAGAKRVRVPEGASIAHHSDDEETRSKVNATLATPITMASPPARRRLSEGVNAPMIF